MAGRRLAPLGLTVLAVTVASWLELLLSGSSAAQLSLIPLSLAVALSVWLGGLVTGLLALVLSVLSMDYFVVEPGSLFQFHDAGAALAYAGFLAAWLLFCVVGDSVHRRMRLEGELRAAAEQAALQAERVTQLSAALAQARTPSAAIESALGQQPAIEGGYRPRRMILRAPRASTTSLGPENRLGEWHLSPHRALGASPRFSRRG